MGEGEGKGEGEGEGEGKEGESLTGSKIRIFLTDYRDESGLIQAHALHYTHLYRMCYCCAVLVK